MEPKESQLDEENLCRVEDMVAVCAGLVTVDEESNIVRLVYYTTQEYFERTQGQWFPKAESEIIIICVTYLLFNEFQSGIYEDDREFEQRLQINKLYDYATHNWGHHAGEASMLILEAISFLERKAQLEASSQGLLADKMYLSDTEYSQRFLKDMTGLHLVAYFGVEAMVKQLLDKDAKLQTKDSDGRTPLSWAAWSGHEAVMTLLLDRGADVTAADSDRETPLY
jgi:Ankyrin repeats (3 copies)